MIRIKNVSNQFGSNCIKFTLSPNYYQIHFFRGNQMKKMHYLKEIKIKKNIPDIISARAAQNRI